MSLKENINSNDNDVLISTKNRLDGGDEHMLEMVLMIYLVFIKIWI